MCGWGTVLGVSKSRLLQDLNSDQEPLGSAASSSSSAALSHSLGQWDRQAFLSQAGIFFSLRLSG